MTAMPPIATVHLLRRRVQQTDTLARAERLRAIAAESCDCGFGHVINFDPLGEVDLDGKRLVPFLLTSAAVSLAPFSLISAQTT